MLGRRLKLLAKKDVQKDAEASSFSPDGARALTVPSPQTAEVGFVFPVAGRRDAAHLLGL